MFNILIWYLSLGVIMTLIITLVEFLKTKEDLLGFILSVFIWPWTIVDYFMYKTKRWK